MSKETRSVGEIPGLNGRDYTSLVCLGDPPFFQSDSNKLMNHCRVEKIKGRD